MSCISTLDFGNTQGQGWKLHLQAKAGDALAAPAYLGVSRAASNGFDQFKLESPPPVGKKRVTVVFEHKDWAEKSGNYSIDVRSVSGTTHSWDFTVTSDVLNTPVTLTWPDIATIPGKNSLTMTDLETSTRTDLRTRGSFAIPASSKPMTRHFRLEVKRAERLPKALSWITQLR